MHTIVLIGLYNNYLAQSRDYMLPGMKRSLNVTAAKWHETAP